jgi:anti-sigma regulatory factor (Ser/Thr protein kinase)
MPIATSTVQPPPAAARTGAQPGTVGRLVSGLAIPGRPEQVQAARQFTDLVLRAHGRDDDGIASLLVSELVTNSVRHSHSGRPGGTVAILVIITPDEVLIGVTDDGGPDEPVPQAAGEDGDDGEAESGRGLRLVVELAARWGHYRHGSQLTIWFTLCPRQPA